MTQKEALKLLKLGKNVFLTGPAGSGKTYVLNEYIQFLKEHGVEVAVTASTGIAATHLKGITIHSWSGIGIKDKLSEYDLDNMEQKAYLWKRFEKTKVLVIDEISMLNSDTLNCVDTVCKMFKKNDLPFGGIQVIFSGDFFQLPPVEKKQQNYFEPDTIYMDDEETSNTPFAFKAKAWKDADLHVCYLSEQYRQDDNNLMKILNEIRGDGLTKESEEILNQKIIQDDNNDLTKLYTHNMNVDNFNNNKLKEVQSEEVEFEMKSKGKDVLIQSLKRGCLVPEKLILKKGALVMFVKNNPVEGYVNGTVGEIVDFDGRYPVVEDKHGNKYIAEPQNWSIEENGKVLAEITQVPLKTAWAITVHKSQGMTLDKAVIDLSGSFVEGQGYVALSRVKSLDGLFLKGFNKMALEVHSEIKNIDKNLREYSDKIFSEIKEMQDEVFDKKHQEFMKNIGARKFKVVDDSGKKINTFGITLEMIKKQKSLQEIIDDRGLKMGTIISHIEKLSEEGDLDRKEINYLMPKNKEFIKMLKLVDQEADKLDEFKLTPIFKALDSKYSFEDIRFAKLFI